MVNTQDKVLSIVCVMLLVVSLGYFYVTTSPQEESEEPDVILSAIRSYTSGDVSKYITAESLYDRINDDNETNDPYIVSIRNAEHYALGHIPGAVNIGLGSLFTEENLARLPTDRDIVVYCYTGHTASQATALLNANGYNALSLKWGMCSWTNDSVVAVNKYFTSGNNYDVVSGSSPGTFVTNVSNNGPQASVHTIPVKQEPLEPLACGGDTEPVIVSEPDTSEISDTESETLRKATFTSLNQGKSAVIKASDLYAILKDGDSSNDPFLLSVRNEEHYVLGHIPGAVNIGLGSLFSDENLARLPEDKNHQIVVVCYTGHTASQATALLNLIGYNATALMWGMCSWTTDTNITVGKCFNMTVDCHDYPFVSGIWDEDMRLTIYTSLNQGKPVAITAETVYERLTDADSTNDPFILSLRKAEHYALGHIPGAINIGITTLFTEENLAKLPLNKQIVVVCYTGHTASQATALLNAIGYNTTALKWGMCSWTTNTTVTVDKCYDQATAAQNYPIIAGSEPGTIQ